MLNLLGLRIEHLLDTYGYTAVFVVVAFLRALAALLAGINCMKARRFLVFTALGAFVWASTFGFSAYALGRQIERISPGVSVALAVGVILAAIAALRFVQRNRTRLQQEADRLSS